ncbi:MAG: class I SAM-dependent methyltransferase [Chitinophagaceae bacterium]|nr:class I SAM-dependent methyltransferase [Chitinophagaceae bacterium]
MRKTFRFQISTCAIQADINNMPFADESFDVVICLGMFSIQQIPKKPLKIYTNW